MPTNHLVAFCFLLFCALACSRAEPSASSTLEEQYRAISSTCKLFSQTHDGPMFLSTMCDFFPLTYETAGVYGLMTELESQESGRSHPPAQMALEQYMAIAAVLMGKSRPRMLFYGCGLDTPAWQRLVVDRLGGELVLLEGTPEWATRCKAASPASDIRPVRYDSTPMNTQSRLLQEGTSHWSQKVGLLSLSEDLHRRDFDVIVVDGPQGFARFPGRAQSVATSVWLARNATPGHHTHLFLHDSARPHERLVLTRFMEQAGTAAVRLGDHLPRKGLAQYLIPSAGKHGHVHSSFSSRPRPDSTSTHHRVSSSSSFHSSRPSEQHNDGEAIIVRHFRNP